MCWEGNPCSSSSYGHRWLDKYERLTLWSSRGTQQSLAMPWGGAPPNLQRGREMATTRLFHSCKATIFFLFKSRDIYVALAVAMSGILIVHVTRIRKWDLLLFFFSTVVSLEPHPATKSTAVSQSWKHCYNSVTHKTIFRLITAGKNINYSSAENNEREKHKKDWIEAHVVEWEFSSGVSQNGGGREGGKKGRRERCKCREQQSLGKPFFPPAATPYCRLSREGASILSSTCGISFKLQQRLWLHKKSRSQMNRGGLERRGSQKTDDSSKLAQRKHSSSAAQIRVPLRCTRAPNIWCQCRESCIPYLCWTLIWAHYTHKILLEHS